MFFEKVQNFLESIGEGKLEPDLKQNLRDMWEKPFAFPSFKE